MNTHPAIEYFESRRRYYRNMTFRRVGFNEADTDEVLHLAQIALWKNWEQANHETLQGWANEVVNRTILQFNRSKRLIKNSCYSSLTDFQITHGDNSTMDDPADFIEALRYRRDPCATIHNERVARVVAGAISRHHRQPILALCALGNSPRATASELGVTVPAVKAVLFAFRRRMKKMLGVSLEKENEVSRSARAA